MDRPDRTADGGFTLVELLVAIAITAVLGGVVVTSVVRTMQVSADATVRVEALTSLQTAHERISRNVRAADPIGAASATSLSLTVWDDAQQRRVITYTLAGDALSQTVETYATPSAASPASTATTPLIDDLAQGATPVFTYAVGDGSAWDGAEVGDITDVTITLIADAGEGRTVPLSTSIFVRNSVL